MSASSAERDTKFAANPTTAWLVSDPATWRRVPEAVVTPTGGVRIDEEGLFQRVMDATVVYLQTDFEHDDMLLNFRKANGIANPPGKQFGWESWITGHAATFLMGVGNTLQWREHSVLRGRMEQLIAGLKALIHADNTLVVPDGGACEGYPITLFAHGLQAAGLAGNREAWEILGATSRAYQRKAAAGIASNINYPFINQTFFSASACMVAHFGPEGTTEDIVTAFQHAHAEWMRQFAARYPAAVWDPPVSWEHSAETYGFVGFLDLYRATGDRRMLDAMMGAWELFHDIWEHPGGSQAICEHGKWPPGSLHITPVAHTGELCSNVWWVKFNQKFHRLFPAQEKYVNEIEKCIYNVNLANVKESGDCRYHTHLEGTKDPFGHKLTCCEALGVYLNSSLPEYIYSVAEDGLYVNLYEPSSIAWRCAGRDCTLKMTSRFPFHPEVSLQLDLSAPTAMKLRVRVPAWAAAEMPIHVNGEPVAAGQPGTYAVLDRTWRSGDTVTFTLPMELRLLKYEGADQVPGHARYAILHGPILMAAVATLDDSTKVDLPDFINLKIENLATPKKRSLLPTKNFTHLVRIAHDPAKMREWLRPIPGKPLHFTVAGQGEPYLMPYWQVDKETFTCFPVIGTASTTHTGSMYDEAIAELAIIRSAGKSVSSPADWNPVPCLAEPPSTAVLVRDGVFGSCMRNNIEYLLATWYGLKGGFWTEDFPETNEGRLLLGAGNALRWMDDATLRGRLDELVAQIGARQEPDGYAMLCPRELMAGDQERRLPDERRNYGRDRFVRGLIAAGRINDAAFRIARRFMDWFNASPYVADMLAGHLGYQGHLCSTQVYLSPAGKPDDLLVAEKYYVQEWWMRHLAKEDPDAISWYPLLRPHSNELTAFEAYLDHYLATGESKYFGAMRGVWNLIRDNWLHPNGGIALCECCPDPGGLYPPKSYYLRHEGWKEGGTPRHVGETCASVSWIDFNHRFHRIRPDSAVYMDEIETTIYNHLLANQGGAKGIRYHAVLHGHKEGPSAVNSCCEQMGTKLYGSLPQFIYSLAGDGVYLNLFEASTLRCELRGVTVKLTMATRFPFGSDVAVTVQVGRPLHAAIHVRVPSWVPDVVPICVNGRRIATGMPGSYETLAREWNDGDVIEFALPMAFRLFKYTGFDQIGSHERHALKCGPILLALVGPLDESHEHPGAFQVGGRECKLGCSRLNIAPEELSSALTPIPGSPLCFSVRNYPAHTYRPYFQVAGEPFTCYPIVEHGNG